MGTITSLALLLDNLIAARNRNAETTRGGLAVRRCAGSARPVRHKSNDAGLSVCPASVIARDDPNPKATRENVMFCKAEVTIGLCIQEKKMIINKNRENGG